MSDRTRKIMNLVLNNSESTSRSNPDDESKSLVDNVESYLEPYSPGSVIDPDYSPSSSDGSVDQFLNRDLSIIKRQIFSTQNNSNTIIDDPSDSLTSQTANTADTENLNETINSSTVSHIHNTSSDHIRKNVRKKLRDPKSWKKNLPKEKRQKGEEYVGRGGKTVPKKKLKCVCSCKLKCETKLTQQNREKVFQKFWSIDWNQRKQFIALSIKVKHIQRRRPRNNKQENRRNHSYQYYLKNEIGEDVLICKTMFLNTLHVTEKFIRNSLRNVISNEKSGSQYITSPDKRQNHPPTRKISNEALSFVRNHIQKFPVLESHYCRASSKKQYLEPGLNLKKMYVMYIDFCKENNIPQKDIVKISYYRLVFNTQFNYSFKSPQLDTCDDCDKFECSIRNCGTDEEKSILIEERRQHHEEGQKRYKLKAEDKDRSKTDDSKEVVCTVDLQKCLPTPCLTNARSFYLRKLWTLNFTICDMTSKETHCMVWDESIGARGSNEISSCILKWILNLPNNIEEITIWSDNCSGQNRNINLIFMYMWILHKVNHIKIINHTYLLKGHTHMEVDVAHSLIERKRKTLSTLQVSVPHDWAQLIRMSKQNDPMKVYELGLNDFLDVGSLGKGTRSVFVNRKRNVDSHIVKISKAVHLQCTSANNGILKYKINFDDEFTEVNLIRHPRKPLVFPDQLPIVSKTPRPISDAKYNNLMELLPWIPESCKDFFKNLPHNSNKPENIHDSDDEDEDD